MKQLLITTIAAVVLVGCGKPSISIHTAARQGNIKAVAAHLDYGTSVNEENLNNKNNTPLHAAIAENKLEIIKLLIQRGANVNLKNDDENTPLDFVMIIRGIESTALELSENYRMPLIYETLRKHGGKTSAELKAEGK